MGTRLEKNSTAVRKRIETHTFDDEQGDEYEASAFGGFGDYFRRKKIKLQNLDATIRANATDKPLIFRGIVAHVNGYTQPSLSDLHHMIVSHGGGFSQYLDGKTSVTHIIAGSLTPKKAVEFRRYRIVKPAWVVDSIRAGQLLPWMSYRVVNAGAGQQLLSAGSDGRISSTANHSTRGYREQSDKSWYTSELKSGGSGSNTPDFQNSQSDLYRRGPTSHPHAKFDDGRHSDEESVTSEDFAISSSLEDALNTASARGEFRRPPLFTQAPERSDVEVSSDKDQAVLQPVDAPQQQLDVASRPEAFSLSPMQQQFSTADPSEARTVLHDQLSKPSSSLLDTEPISGDVSEKEARSHPSEAKPAVEAQSTTKPLTAEEHNAILLQDPRIRESSTANPDFLKKFYAESRLHHLSTWKADLKAQMQRMSDEKSASQKPAKVPRGARCYVMHVDFDSFFCAVSLKKVPEYKDKPAAVAHSSGPGSEIASCNYSARQFGIKNGQWMRGALEKCPHLKVLPYDFPAYEEASRDFYKAILEIGGTVQSVSIDEALVDVSSICYEAGSSAEGQEAVQQEQDKADELALRVRSLIRENTDCEVSVGIGSNILQAKVALRKAKPAGQFQLKPEEVLDFIGELTVRDLPGVAYSLGGRFEEMEITHVKDLRALSKDRLVTVFGPKTGEKMWEYARGIDRAEVGDQVVRKSVSAEVNWGIRFISQAEAEEFVQNLCGELERRLVEQRVRGKQLTMKIMRRAQDAPLDPPKHLGHGKCDTYNKSVSLGVATNAADVLGREAVSILRSYSFSAGELRGLGVQMTKLEPIKTGPESSQKKLTWASPKRAGPADPIVDSPEKATTTSVHPAKAILQSEAEKGATSKLNLMGTQFIIPSQMDPAVLEELPTDIRSRLMAQGKKPAKPGTQSPRATQELPSQLDPDVFDALPDDVKAEVLASYPSYLQSEGPSRSQSVLPQSPHKNRTINPLAKKQITPTKKKSLLARSRRGGKLEPNKQASFVPAKPAEQDAADDDLPDLDPDFLAALPPDVRHEVVTEHRRQRAARNGALGLHLPAARPSTTTTAPSSRSIALPPKPPKPTFTAQKLSTLAELRDAVAAWHAAFRADGPLADDVAALQRYLARVVGEERDAAKAVAVARWVAWVVDADGDGSTEVGEPATATGSTGVEAGRRAWLRTVEAVRAAVQDAIRARGLGAVDI